MQARSPHTFSHKYKQSLPFFIPFHKSHQIQSINKQIINKKTSKNLHITMPVPFNSIIFLSLFHTKLHDLSFIHSNKQNMQKGHKRIQQTPLKQIQSNMGQIYEPFKTKPKKIFSIKKKKKQTLEPN